MARAGIAAHAQGPLQTRRPQSAAVLALGQLVDAAQADPGLDTAELHTTLCDFLLGLIVDRLLHPDARHEEHETARSGRSSWLALCDEVARRRRHWWPDAGRSGLPRVEPLAHLLRDGQLSLAPEALPRVLAAATADLEDVPAPSVLPAKQPITELGRAHEHLLGCQLQRLGSRALYLRTARVWLELGPLLQQAPQSRGQWLQQQGALGKRNARLLSPALAKATRIEQLALALRPHCSGDPRPRGALVLNPGMARRRSGSHYTPEVLSRQTVEQTLGPLLQHTCNSADLLRLCVCDPAMGSGAFLIEVCELLSQRLLQLWRAEKREPRVKPATPALLLARRAVAEHCLFGVDKNEQSVSLARLSVALYTHAAGLPPLRLERLRRGDAVFGRVAAPQARAAKQQAWDDALLPSLCAPRTPQSPDTLRRFVRGQHAFHWGLEFRQVFSGPAPGFDAVVGNPPWVAYVGRATQPLDERLARHYQRSNPAFVGYRTLHGLFLRRSAELLRRGGRLGLVVPTSVVDLSGYAATRAAVAALCQVDTPLPDFGDGHFADVFQPCTAVLATRRDRDAEGSSAPWPLHRTDLEAGAEVLLLRLASLPHLPAELFGERGYQTNGDDRAVLRQQASPSGPFSLPLREGSDIVPFVARPPTLFAAAAKLSGRLRSSAEWARVRLLIRQTARYPIAAPADGIAFRNSVLAGFDDPSYSAAFLLCYLNSDVVRWYHYMSNRDARQGMPQLKIAHLRSLPAPLASRAQRGLTQLGERLLAARRAPNAQEMAQLNRLAAQALRLSASESALISNWAAAHPLPVPRSAVSNGRARRSAQ